MLLSKKKKHHRYKKQTTFVLKEQIESRKSLPYKHVYKQIYEQAATLEDYDT